MDNELQDLTKKSQDILDRLKVVFDAEGLIVAIDHIEGDTLHINMERTAKGAPVIFMAKAIGGTFRRYLPAIQNVLINNFKNSLPGAPEERTEEKPLFSFNGLPELNMSGIDPHNAVLALDNFMSLVKRHNLHKCRITWKDRVEAATILPRWVKSINACMHQQGDMAGKYIVHIPAVSLDANHDPHCGMKEEGDVLPARIMLTLPTNPGEAKPPTKPTQA